MQPPHHRPFARTNYYYNLFVPHTVPIWNTLPVLFVSNSYVPHFRSHVWMHIAHQLCYFMYPLLFGITCIEKKKEIQLLSFKHLLRATAHHPLLVLELRSPMGTIPCAYGTPCTVACIQDHGTISQGLFLALNDDGACLLIQTSLKI